jgi:putative hemolysin
MSHLRGMMTLRDILPASGILNANRVGMSPLMIGALEMGPESISASCVANLFSRVLL